MAILTNSDIKKLLESQVLTISPLLDPERQIGDASVDLRLGNEFIGFRRTNLGHIDPSHREELRANLERYQEKVRVSYGKSLVLHPGQFVLGASLEYLALPDRLAGQVVGRSSWGRLGLIIATATAVDPGFRGCITLELVNHGEIPIVLYPGVRIAQLVLCETTSPVRYTGRYQWPTGPQFSRLHEDPDIELWADEEKWTER